MKSRNMILVLLTTLVLGLLLSACGQPSVADAKQQFCDSLNAVNGALENVKSIDENTSVDAARQAKEELSKAWDGLNKAADQLKQAQLDESKDAYNQMVKALDGAISGETSLGDSAQVINSGAEQLSVALKAINTTVCGVK